MIFTTQTTCRICQSPDLTDFFDLGAQALSGCFPGPDEADPPQSPLTLCRCGECGLVQLRHSTDPAHMFTDKYGYRSSLNKGMMAHLHGLQQWAAERVNIKPGDLVVDIGANDGTLLGFWADANVARMAIDPLLSKFGHLYPDSIEQVRDFFTRDVAHKALAGREAKVITSVAMFYDLPDPNDFVAGIAASLSPNGIWVVQMGYLPAMLDYNAFDSICHEHLEYYALAQLQWLADANGLQILDAEENDCNGGSFRLALARKSADLPVNSTAIDAMRQRESDMALDTPAPYDAFTARIDDLRARTRALLSRLHDEGASIWLYGASTKGNVLLQHYGIDHEWIKGAVEVNAEKFGHRTPGTGIPIVNEADILAQKPDYFLVMPWHFRDNILARADQYRAAGVKFIFPLPELEVV